MKKTKKVCGLLVFGALLWLLPSTGGAATWNVDCSTGGVIQTAINGASPGDIISVTGTCTEFVDVTKGIIIDGNNTAVINGPDNTQPTVRIRAASVTIQNFASIQGGQDGIFMSGYGPTILNNTIQSTGRDGIFISSGGSPTINSNTIRNTARHGITVYANGFAVVINNDITNNPGHGIQVVESSDVRIGFSSSSDTSASPNLIDSNGGDGIDVIYSSNARIVGNTISNNVGDGISVTRLSHADISENLINGNANGITVSFNSAVNLGNSSGTSIFDMPNDTNANNDNRGVIVTTNSDVTGRLGTLSGVNGVIGYGFEGIATMNPLYRLDVSGNAASRSQLHFSLSGTDTGGWVTSVLDNNFFLSSGAMYDQSAGGWIQKSADGNAVIAGSGGAGYRVFTTSGNTVGSPIASGNMPVRLQIDYSGNMGINTPADPTVAIDTGTGAYLSLGGVWTSMSSREAKEDIKDLSTGEAMEALNGLNPVKFAYKADRTEKHVGFIAEDVPDLIATKDRKGLSPMDIVAVLTKVIQEQQQTIQEQRKVTQEQEKIVLEQQKTVEEHRKIISVLSERMAELERVLQLRGTLVSVTDRSNEGVR